MDLRQLRYFTGIAQAGSVSRAADQMHVAQSALSHHLASLEAELNRQLVTRGPKGIQLTEAGNVFYRHAEAILRHVEFAKRDAMCALSVPSGRVSIGFPLVLAALLSYQTFARVHRAYPQIVLHITDASYAVVRERLMNGRLDMALLFMEQPESALAVEPLLYEELVYVTAKPNTSPITLAEAAQQPLLAAGPHSNSRRVAQEAFNKHGLAVTWIGEIDTLSALRQAVAGGIGDAIMSWSALYEGEGKTALSYRRFADEKLVRPLALCFSEVGQRSPAVEAVALTVKSLIRDLVEGGKWQGASLIAPADGGTGAAAMPAAGAGQEKPQPVIGVP